VDLLGYVGQKGRDEKYPYREGSLKDERRDAQALLLGGVHSSLEATFLPF